MGIGGLLQGHRCNDIQAFLKRAKFVLPFKVLKLLDLRDLKVARCLGITSTKLNDGLVLLNWWL